MQSCIFHSEYPLTPDDKEYCHEQCINIGLGSPAEPRDRRDASWSKNPTYYKRKVYNGEEIDGEAKVAL